MSLILTIETSGPLCSVALFSEEILMDNLEVDEQGAHSTQLTLLIEKILKRNQLKITDLNSIAISIGPGSYTGLRIGLSTAKGLCFGADIPLISLSTLEIMVEAAKETHSASYYLPMMDARRMEVYAGVFNAKGEITQKEDAYILTENPFIQFENQDILCFGNGALKWDWAKQHSERFIENIVPRAKFMGKLAFEKFKSNNFENLVLIEPEYLKEYQGKI